MSRHHRSLDRRVSRRTAFQALFNSFNWLTHNASCDHSVEWLGEYPLLSARSPRNAFNIFRFLCNDTKDAADADLNSNAVVSATLLSDLELAKRLSGKIQYVAFTYLDSNHTSHDSGEPTISNQQNAIRDLFRPTHKIEDLLLVRSDNLHTNGYNSIREGITNLIAAEFFMSRGYIVLEDTGSGPDVIAFKSSVVNMLKERRFIGKGASMHELAAVGAFGKVNENCKDDTLEEEIIAIESESVSPKTGISQLRGGYCSKRFAYMGFFDSRVLAAPFLNSGATSFDVLTYGANGVEYWEANKSGSASGFWISKKRAFLEELHNSMKAMLLLNLTFEEIVEVVSGRPSTMAQVLREIPRLHIEKILDKVEGIL
jgi:hypothetical protein